MFMMPIIIEVFLKTGLSSILSHAYGHCVAGLTTLKLLMVRETLYRDKLSTVARRILFGSSLGNQQGAGETMLADPRCIALC